ncbi:MAG: LysM peptidoglycan-binding domain-containing protein, partial [Burkholderiales bacterium]|nr:LysM peptidoglycan-binding domain-containing protein [Burkholderiales bacterium]
MSIRDRRCTRAALRLAAACAATAALQGSALAQDAAHLPVLPQWRATAQRVAQAGIPLAELAPNAPDSHVVQRGDTLWGISALFLKSPWRWPELWGMNLDQVRNPHLIYPGQILVLEKKDGRATLHLARSLGQEPTNTVRLSPHVRSEVLDNGAIASIPLDAIGPFLNEAVVFDTDALANSPRIVATQEGRVMVSRGETAYVRGDLKGATDFRIFRELKPLVDPVTHEVLGYEGRYVGTAAFVRSGGIEPAGNGKGVVVPDTFRITSTTLEAGVGDRLAPVPQQDFIAYVPHAPAGTIECRVISVYGDGLIAGQNQVVSINRGRRDGIERGNVLALWRAGVEAVDTTEGKKVRMQLPDERHGLLFVFRV